MLTNKTVLITGGTGTFGRAFLKRLMGTDVGKIIVFSRDELKQSEMQRNPELSDKRIRYFLGDVRDRDRMYRALDGVDIVIHAAALKQIDACSYNPMEAVKTNVLGAMNLIDAAIDRGVEKVVALSTDKACEPTTLYGKTKACLEGLITEAGAYSPHSLTKFACCRYGNIANSRGSVIPFFKQVAARGEPLPITHKSMTRFWYTIDGAVDLVLHALGDMQGGEIYVPDLPSFRVVDLAEAIAPGKPTTETGIRLTEKLHEKMIGINESREFRLEDGRFVRRPGWTSPFDEYELCSSGLLNRLNVQTLRAMIEQL